MRVIVMLLWATLTGVHLSQAQITPDESAWLARHIQPLSTVDTSFHELGFLEDVLRGRSVLQLGAGRSQPVEVIRLHTRIVRYLHERLGFDVLVLEGGLSDCGSAYLDADSLDARTIMQACSRRVCRFEEMIPLFDYIRRTRRTARPLILAGNDIMPTGNRWPKVMVRLAGQIGYSDPAGLLKADSLYSRLWVDHLDDEAYIEHTRAEVATHFGNFLEYLREHGSRLDTLRAGGMPVVRWLQRAVENRILALEPRHFANRETIEAGRDEAMGANIVHMARRLYPDRKLVVIAANGHVSEGYSRSNGRFRRAGEFVTDALGEAVYTVGFYTGGGEAPHFTETIAPAPLPGSLEERFQQSGFEAAFLDVSAVSRSDRHGRWLFLPTPTYQEFRFPQTIIPSEHYDGLLFVRRVTLPTALTEKSLH